MFFLWISAECHLLLFLNTSSQTIWATLDSQMGLWETRWPQNISKRSRPRIVWKPTIFQFSQCCVQFPQPVCRANPLWLCLHSGEGGRSVGGGVVHLFVWSQRAVTSPYLVRWRESASLGISLKGKRSHDATFATFLPCVLHLWSICLLSSVPVSTCRWVMRLFLLLPWELILSCYRVE